MKNAQKYLKFYDLIREENYEQHGYYGPPFKTWEEYEEDLDRVYENHLKNSDQRIKHPDERYKKTSLYLGLLNDLQSFGFYLAIKAKDFELLNNVLYQGGLRDLLNSASFTGFQDNSLSGLTHLFASNHFEHIEKFLPPHIGLSGGGYGLEVNVNLLKVMLYDRKDLRGEAVEIAEQFLQKKRIPKREHYGVRYFLALLNRDAEEASRCLQESCKALQRTQISWGYRNKLFKCFDWGTHAYYRLARFIDEDFFAAIEPPTHPSFSQEFEDWQKENNYPKGRLFYQYPEKLDYMNKILQAEIPVATIKKRKYFRQSFDSLGDQFMMDLTVNVESNLINFQ